MPRRPWILLAVLFVISLPAVTPRIYSSDEIEYFAYLRSLWFDRDLSFDNEYRYFYDRGIARSQGFRETFLERTTETGRRLNFGTIGCALLWAPFYAAGDVVARVLRASGRDTPVDGFSQPYISAVAYGSAFFGAAALVLAMLSAEFLRLRALGSTLAVWFGTPLLFYMYVAPPMSHCCSAFAVALFVYIWLHVRRRWSVRGCILLGASAALMAMVREQDLFFVTGPALDFGLSVLAHSQSVKSRAQSVVAALAAFALCFTPQAIAYLTLNGHVGPSKLVTRKMSWTAPHTLQVLVSSEHGLFVWTPLALLAIAGLVRMALSARAAALSGREQMESERPALTDLSRVAVWMLLMVAFQVYVAGSVESWTVAGGYGQRRFVALSALLVIGLAALLQGVRIGFARKALAVAMVLAVYWNVALIAEFATGLMDRQRLSPRQNAYDAFVTLPRHLPSLAYRYFFDRASFYQSKSALDAQ